MGLNADPGCRRDCVARLKGLWAKSRPPTSARTSPVCGSIATRAACKGAVGRLPRRPLVLPPFNVRYCARRPPLRPHSFACRDRASSRRAGPTDRRVSHPNRSTSCFRTSSLKYRPYASSRRSASLSRNGARSADRYVGAVDCAALPHRREDDAAARKRSIDVDGGRIRRWRLHESRDERRLRDVQIRRVFAEVPQ